jgi:predicted class III extradiol MEMO1 family dioxygenase
MVVGAQVERTKVDTDRDRAYVEAETQRTEREHTARMAELSVKRELALLEYATKRDMKLSDVKAALSQTAMKLRTQRELAGADNQLKAAAQVATPAIEPPGRAQNGRAFQQ